VASEKWADFVYWGFWDIPRCILATLGDETYFLDCPFDEALDDYRPEFTVYLMPEISRDELVAGARDLPSRAISTLGTWPVSETRLDSSLRKKVDLGFIEELRPQPRPVA